MRLLVEVPHTGPKQSVVVEQVDWMIVRGLVMALPYVAFGERLMEVAAELLVQKSAIQ